MKTNATLALLVLMTLPALSVGADAPPPLRQEMPLETYNFVRSVFHPQDIEYLMGNAEMGGWADKKGTGFAKLWFTDVWQDSGTRIPIAGPLLACAELDAKDWSAAVYRHELNIRTGVLGTSVRWPDGSGYSSRLFFSKINKHLLIIRLTNESSVPLTWTAELPKEGFTVQPAAEGCGLAGISENPGAFTRVAWTLGLDRPLLEGSGGAAFSLPAGSSALVSYALTTHFDGDDYSVQAARGAAHGKDFATLVREHEEAWDRQWKSIASIILPPGDYAKWFYRAVYALYATAGADHFLPGEEQFSIPDSDWHMHSFTYGHGGGWSVWAFAGLGDQARALNMLRWMYKPQALKDNVRILFPQLGPVELVYKGKSKGIHTYLEADNPDALAFGHEVLTDGHNLTYPDTAHWDLQRHLDGFASSSYYLYHRYFPSAEFTNTYAYPVLRGTAEFYSSLAKWDAARGLYYFPPLLSVSENIVEKSVLDAVLSARWDLKTAADLAVRLNRDEPLRNKWRQIAEKLYVPQNDETYLEYLDDTQERGGGGYFGIRAFMYLGYPLLESLKDVDRAKARRALDQAWLKNRQGEGMITFIMNWFALTEAYLGYGENAYRLSSLMTQTQDPSGVCLYEALSKNKDGTVDGFTPYFLTGYSSLVLVPIAMMLHSFDDVISVFPAMPAQLRDVAFYDLPAEAGIRVSARMEGGRINWIAFNRDGKVLLRLKDNKKVAIIRKADGIALKTAD